MPMWGSTYSSVYPDLANTNETQDILTGEVRDEVLSWIKAHDGGLDLTKEEIDEKMNGRQPVSLINPDFDDMVMVSSLSVNIF